MVHFIPFSILIFNFISCISWLFKDKITSKTRILNFSQEFKLLIDCLKWDQDLPLSEGFSLLRSHEIEEEISNGKMKSFSLYLTIIKNSFYEIVMESFGSILFDKEMNAHKVAIISCDKTLKFLRISWTILDQSNSNYLFIQKLFKKYFPFLGNDDIYHIKDYLFKKTLSYHMKNIKFDNKSKVFKNQENLLQLYNKRDADFNGQIILMCSLDSSTRNKILDFTIKDIKSFVSKNHVRFGAYINNENSLLESFAFYQLDSPNSNVLSDEQIDKFSFGHFLVISVISPIKFTCLDQFVEFITHLALCQCK